MPCCPAFNFRAEHISVAQIPFSKPCFPPSGGHGRCLTCTTGSTSGGSFGEYHWKHGQNASPPGADYPFSIKSGAGAPGLFFWGSDIHQDDEVGLLDLVKAAPAVAAKNGTDESLIIKFVSRETV